MRRATDSADIDLTEALRERGESVSEPGFVERRHVGGRRPAIRTGGRIRMDVARSTRSGPRYNPVPGAPRYRRNAKPLNWKAIAAGIAFAALMIVGAERLLTAPKLAITRVQIAGVTPSTASLLDPRVRPALGHNLLAYAALHGLGLQKQIVSAQPDFASARVGIRLPSTLTVCVTTRTPVAILAVGASGAGGIFLLDERAVPIRDVSGALRKPAGLPKIMVPAAPASAVVLGKALPAAMGEQASEAFTLLSALKKQSDGVKVASIQVDKSLNLGLNMDNHLRIKLGQSTQLTEKLALVNSLLSQRPEIAAEARYIDVSFPARPAMMPKSADAGASGAAAVGIPPEKPAVAAGSNT